MVKRFSSALVLLGAVWSGAVFASSRSGCKSKTFNNLTVCNLLTAGSLKVINNVTVGGTVTAAGFNTPSGPFFSGLRNYGVFSNDTAILTGSASVPWTNVGSSAGISAAGTTITLPTTGVFFVQYSVRFTGAFAALAAGSGVAQLRQAGSPIGTPAITTNAGAVAAVIADTFQFMVTGSALITTSSAANNTIDLLITLTGGYTLPVATAPDANAQLWIMQMN